MKNPLTPAGIEPATFRFVAQHLNRCATAVSTDDNVTPKIKCLLSPITARQFCHIASLFTPVHSATPAKARSED